MVPNPAFGSRMEINQGRPDKPDIHHYKKKLDWARRALEKEPFEQRDKQLIKEFVDFYRGRWRKPWPTNQVLLHPDRHKEADALHLRSSRSGRSGTSDVMDQRIRLQGLDEE